MKDYTELIKKLPAPVATELYYLNHAIETDNWHGMIFAMKDTYETLTKYVCLCMCASIEAEGDDSFCKILLSPEKSLSFGDWTNDILSCVRKSKWANDCAIIKNFCKKLTGLYTTSGIVSWRNETIGHGLMEAVPDESMKQDIQEKMDQLEKFLVDHPFPAELVIEDEQGAQILGYQDRYAQKTLFLKKDGKLISTEPFLCIRDEQLSMFESVDRHGVCRYSNYTKRCRLIADGGYWTEKRKKYFDVVNVSDDTTCMDDVYLSNMDKTMDGFHISHEYMKPEYMQHWVENCLEAFPSGVFLMQGGRNTGKSSFVYACDDLAGHDKQNIKLSDDVSTRAFYCSRISFSGQNDFSGHLIDCLRQSKDGQEIRFRNDSIPSVADGMGNVLKFFREAYEHIYATEKLLIFIDGIDELRPEDVEILRDIPSAAQMPDGVYMILTCRKETSEIPPQVCDFINIYHFTDQVCFELDQENEELLRRYLEEKLKFNKNQSLTLAKALEDRFSALPLLRYFSVRDIWNALAGNKNALRLENLADAYLKLLEQRYGARYFSQFVEFLVLIADETEPLTMLELAFLVEQQRLPVRYMCFLKDASPFLIEYRHYRGNVYVFAQEELRKWIKERYKKELLVLAEGWELRLQALPVDQTVECSIVELDTLLYMGANLARIYRENEKSIADKRILKTMLMICYSVAPDQQIHRVIRSQHGLETIFYTIAAEIQKHSFEMEDIEMFLDVAARMVHQYAILQRHVECEQMINKVEDCITILSCEGIDQTPRIRLQIAIFCSQAMLYYADLYQIHEAEAYFLQARKLLEDMSGWSVEELKKGKEINKALIHNYIGLYRNIDFKRVEPFLQELYEIALAGAHDYSAVSDMLMVAMAYKSGRNEQKAEEILREACGWFDNLGEPETIMETELQTVTHWRLCQSINERCHTNQVTLSEIRMAKNMMDDIINHTIMLEQQGYLVMALHKPDFMTTGMLLRGTEAVLLSVIPDQKEQFDIIKKEAIQAADTVRTLYQNMKVEGVSYDRVTGCFNLMNCACIYAEFGRYAEALQQLEEILKDLNRVQNPAEEQVRAIVSGKYEEIRRCMGR